MTIMFQILMAFKNAVVTTPICKALLPSEDLYGFHKRSHPQLWLSHWLKRGQNMAARIHSPLQNLNLLKI